MQDWQLTQFTVKALPFPRPVILELEPTITVLFGWNGMGKTWALERILNSLRATHPEESPTTSELKFENIQKHDDAYVAAYRHFATFSDRETSLEIDGDTIWRLADGRVDIETPPGLMFIEPGGMFLRSRTSLFPDNALWLRHFANGMELIRPAMRLGRQEDNFSVMELNGETGRYRGFGDVEDHVLQLAVKLANWEMEAPHLFTELVAVLERIQVTLGFRLDKVKVASRETEFAFPFACGRAFDKLSDGTLRTIQLCAALVDPNTQFLMIDEPENSLYPGRLACLLNEIRAYSYFKQIVICTHSPQVVDWAAPSSLRLVTMEGDAVADMTPAIRALTDDELEQAREYLEHEGSLGEWVFYGRADCEE